MLWVVQVSSRCAGTPTKDETVKTTRNSKNDDLKLDFWVFQFQVSILMVY